MKWRSVVAAVLLVLRNLLWLTLGGLAIDDLVRFQKMFGNQEGAPQQCALAGSVLVELLVAYIVARAADRFLELSSPTSLEK
jgi:hypothetical protein